jgi:hypothetical protein
MNQVYHAIGGADDSRQHVDDLDIWRAADLLIKQHGDDAELVAALRSDAMLDKADTEGCRVWNRIRQAIRTLREIKPRDREMMN